MKKKTLLLSSMFVCLSANLLNSQIFVDGAGVTDIDGNFYNSVIYQNNQEWLVENLKTTKYATGDLLMNFSNSSDWVNATSGGWQFMNDDAQLNDPYGKLYNAIAVYDSRSLCPTGWHIPTQLEWNSLIDELGGTSVAGGKMKVMGTTFWQAPNTGATNESGFSAYPGGDVDEQGNFAQLTTDAFWWSSTEYQIGYSWFYGLSRNYGDIGSNVAANHAGFSVRCMRINPGATLEEGSKSNQIQSYPNPTENQIHIRFDISLIGTNFIIVDQLGKNVLSGIISTENMLINLEELTKGIYFIGSENDTNAKIKIVKIG